MDRDDVAFPDPNEIAPHAIAFARAMFAHAAFEREVHSLIDAINPKEPGFGERRENQWTASDSGTARFIVLIMRYHGLSQAKQIRNILNEAVDLYRQRNFLAHGTWWCFNRRTKTVKVRSQVRWEQSELAPENLEYTASDIEKLADRFKDITAELYKIRSSFEPKMTEAEMRAASSFLRAPWRTPGSDRTLFIRPRAAHLHLGAGSDWAMTPRLSGELALMPRSDALAGVNLAPGCARLGIEGEQDAWRQLSVSIYPV